VKGARYQFEEYPLEIEYFDPALLRITGTWFQLPWLASFKNWPWDHDSPGPGNGATREEAIQQLRKQFDVYAATHRLLPDPSCPEGGETSNEPVTGFRGFEDLFELFIKVVYGNFYLVWLWGNRTIGELLACNRFEGYCLEKAFQLIKEIWDIPPEEARPMKIRNFLKRVLDAFPWYRTAFVGLFWYHHGAVPGNLYHLTNAYVFDRFLGPYRSHEDFWPTLQPTLRDIGVMKVGDLPRGRVIFDFRNRKFVMIADPKILSDPAAVAGVREAFHLPEQMPVQFEEDPFYGPFPTSFPIDPTPADCFERRCSSYDTDGWIRVVEKPHQFWGWRRTLRVVRRPGNTLLGTVIGELESPVDKMDR